MIDPNLESLCESIRVNLDCASIPVDPEQIADREGIILAPDNYGEGFDGRIEYIPSYKRFVIYYQESYLNSSRKRVRFSLAHELGHYYIESHREKLCSGRAHDSKQALSSDKDREREADSFAASLLIPKSELDRRIGRKGFMDMSELVKMSYDIDVSIPAAAIRYFGYAEEKCSIVMSADGKVLCHLPSDSMRDIGLRFIQNGSPVPPQSAARELLFESASQQIKGKTTTSDEWYQGAYNNFKLYEDSYALGYGNRVITLLSVQ